MAASAKPRVAILISGRGSNMASLIAAAQAPDYPAEIALVAANRPAAGGLAHAAGHGIPTRALDHTAYPSREAFDAALQAELVAARIDLVCLAGFMRIFSAGFVEAWAGRMINIHPSVLPKFKGLNPQQQAIDAGVHSSGCTVHWVVPALDEGPVIRIGHVDVFPFDTAETLAARILVEEHKTYPAALKRVALGDAYLSPDGKKTVFLNRLHNPDGSVEVPFLSHSLNPDEFAYATEEEFEEIAKQLDAAVELHSPLKAWADLKNADEAGELDEFAEGYGEVPDVVLNVRSILEAVIRRERTGSLAVDVSLEYMYRKGWTSRHAWGHHSNS